ncbi:MAG TPA: PQQ-dependent sugar dehydrogenase [Candidatus Thermoplasmatota archaeon]|nr:PQQ-dependent sugar dehydrogenase [Candidatus Thermoplasmatota archaeon]
MRLVVALLVVTAALAGCAAPEGSEPRSGPTPPTDGGNAPNATFREPRIGLAPFLSGLSGPILITHAGDGSGRLFVVEQGGRVKVVTNGTVSPLPFLDVSPLISTGGERGLLGLAFAPDFETTGRFFVDYTDREGDTVVARYRTAAANLADPASATTILSVKQPYPNHNGGHLAFGPDGFLYVGLGDGGSGGDPEGHAQDKNSLLGKILRLDVKGEKYAIPPNNPFTAGAGRPEIWAWGLRNPWRFSFDRETGDLWIADVGQREREEVNFQPAKSLGGENYGWNVWEGTKRFKSGEASGNVVFPVAEYDHGGGHCSVTGGYAYRGGRIPDLVGTFVYGDFCSGTIWGTRAENGTWVTRKLLDTDHRIASFGEDEAGELYVVDIGGRVLRVIKA